MTARTWADMDAAPRADPRTLTAAHVPDAPGVYAWYRDGQRMYVGKADVLRKRVRGDHLGESKAVSNSAFRRNVAEHLGFGRAADIKKRAVALTDDQLAAMRTWILGCEVAWLTCASKADAIDLETQLKAEHKPPLTKR